MGSLSALTAENLLSVWEAGAEQPLARRAVLLLSAARPGTAYDAWAQIPLGRRDAELLRLRAELFGPRLVSLVTCPNCGGQLQLTFDAAELGAADAIAAPGADAEILTLARPPYTLRYRLPNSADVLAAGQSESVEAARGVLLRRCLESAERDQSAVTPDELPAEVVDALTAQMALADPQADLQVDVTCPSCGKAWATTLDVAAYLWAEIDRWARRLLREVHALASAYGWSESDILALSAARRQAYLDLIRE